MIRRAESAMAEDTLTQVAPFRDHTRASERPDSPEAPSYYLPSPGRLELGAVRVETIALMVVAGAVVYFLLHALVRVVGDSFQTYQQAVG